MSQRVKPCLAVHKGPLEHPDAWTSPADILRVRRVSVLPSVRFSDLQPRWLVLAFVLSSSSVVHDGASPAMGHLLTEGHLVVHPAQAN